MFSIADVRKQLKLMGFHQHIPDSILQSYVSKLRKQSAGDATDTDPARPVETIQYPSEENQYVPYDFEDLDDEEEENDVSEDNRNESSHSVGRESKNKQIKENASRPRVKLTSKKKVLFITRHHC